MSAFDNIEMSASFPGELEADIGLGGNERGDVQRIRVLSEVLGGRRTVGSAAAVLELTPRQARRLLARLRHGGGGAIGPRLRGRPSNHQIEPGIQSYAIDLIRERYADFGRSLATEKLAESHGMRVCAETLQKWMIAAGLR